MTTSEEEIEVIEGEQALAEQLIGEVTEKIEELGKQRERLVVLSTVFTRSLKDLRENPVQSALAIESDE
jgi:KaiC/GvpD/RAD55 family RecA-like ATPase